jgi:hypothetical protein
VVVVEVVVLLLQQIELEEVVDLAEVVEATVTIHLLEQDKQQVVKRHNLLNQVILELMVLDTMVEVVIGQVILTYILVDQVVVQVPLVEMVMDHNQVVLEKHIQLLMVHHQYFTQVEAVV